MKNGEIYDLLSNSFYNHFKSNHSLFLDGFITFRLKKYWEFLSDEVDKAVNQYIVEREYNEFISILKIYINTEPSSCDSMHLIYANSKPTLLDNNKNVIQINKDLFNSKYLSDITFSENDFIFNTILNLVPKKIYIHLVDENVDEFITTLKLIFEDRAIYCTDCSICNLYKKSHALK